MHQLLPDRSQPHSGRAAIGQPDDNDGNGAGEGGKRWEGAGEGADGKGEVVSIEDGVGDGGSEGIGSASQRVIQLSQFE